VTEREFVHRGFGGEAGPADIAPYVLLTASRDEAGAIARRWSDARLVADHYAFGVWTGHVGETRLTACSTGTGSASAAIAVEELAVLGARTILALGATREALEPADAILVAEGAFRADAASHGYVRAGFPAIADVEVTLAAVTAIRAAGARLLHGVVADVDAALDARVGVPPRRSARAAAVAAGIREAGAIAVHASPAVLLVAGTVHRLRTGFLAADAGPDAQARLRDVAVATLLQLAAWDRGVAGAPTPVAERVAALPPGGHPSR
jgi:uridine phosphorylase